MLFLIYHNIATSNEAKEFALPLILFIAIPNLHSPYKKEAATSKVHFSTPAASLALMATTAFAAIPEARQSRLVFIVGGTTPEAGYQVVPPKDGTLFAIGSP